MFILPYEAITMSRTTVSLDEESEAIIERETGDGGEYESRSAFVRECVKRYERAEDLQQQVDELESDLEARRDEIEDLRGQRDDRDERIADLEDEIDEREARINDLRNQLQAANAKDERVDTLATYVENEREAEQRWREASILTRMKWRVTGMPAEG
jgi:Arc/MetJ-type ribon-helix-helix transcriptional regulator